jgi:ribose transport system permease protein
MGGVILIGVLIDQQWNAIRAQRRLVAAARQTEARIQDEGTLPVVANQD